MVGVVVGVGVVVAVVVAVGVVAAVGVAVAVGVVVGVGVGAWRPTGKSSSSITRSTRPVIAARRPTMTSRITGFGARARLLMAMRARPPACIPSAWVPGAARAPI